jgi:hypothetical protein
MYHFAAESTGYYMGMLLERGDDRAAILESPGVFESGRVHTARFRVQHNTRVLPPL